MEILCLVILAAVAGWIITGTIKDIIDDRRQAKAEREQADAFQRFLDERLSRQRRM